VITLGIPLSGTGGRCSFYRYKNTKAARVTSVWKYLKKVIKGRQRMPSIIFSRRGYDY